jgi:phage replication O-like protein O
MFHVPAPNFTQTPNALCDDWLPLLGIAELKVLMVIMRKTFGWHKIRDRISLSQLEKLTGLGRKHILKAVKGLQEKNLILKIVEGEKGTQNTFYELIVIEDSNNLYQCPKDTPPSGFKPPTKETLPKERREENKQKKVAPSANASSLADFFLSKIKEKKPDFSKGITPKWHKDFETLLKKRSEDQIKKVINFAFMDAFWNDKVLSPEKILKHLDTLELQMTKPGNKMASEDARAITAHIRRRFGSDNRIDFFVDGIGFNFPGGGSKVVMFTQPAFGQEVTRHLKNLGFNLSEVL